MRTLFLNASSEFQLAAACCRWPASSARSERITQLNASSIDWPCFLRLVERHRIAGLACQVLNEELTVPIEVRESLGASATRIAQQNLLSIAIASRIARRFEQEDVAFVVMKGAPLAQLAYGLATVRHSKDIDLLVRPEDIARAESLLAAEGFHRTSLAASIAAHQQPLWLRYRKHFEYVHKTNRAHVELHWRTLDNRNALMHDLLAQREWVSVAPGIDLPALPRKELLLHLCAHGASHAWFRLKWLADIAALLHHETPASMGALFHEARQRDFDRPLHLAILLCEALFDTQKTLLPQAPTFAVRWMARVASEALLADDHDRTTSSRTEFVPRGQTALRFMLRRGWRYRVEELRVNTSSPIDWQTLRLPPRLQFLYPVLRAPLWLKRRLSVRAQTGKRS